MRRKGNSTTRLFRWQHAALQLSILVAFLWTQTVFAGELAYGVGYTIDSSDNIQRTATNTINDVTNSIFAGFNYLENGPAFDAHLTASAEYLDYKNDTYIDGPLYYIDASLLWKIAPQRMHWIIIDRYDQITLDSSLPDTRGNLVNANVMSTGPDFFIRLGQVNTLALEMRYGKASYDEGYDGEDSKRYAAAVRWLYAANSETTYSLNYQAEQVYFKDDIQNDNFTRQDSFLRAEQRQARSRFLLDLGITKIERDKAGETNGPVARLTWLQQLTSESSVGMLFASEYLDAGSALLDTATNAVPDPGAPPPSAVTGEITSDLYYQKSAEVFYRRSNGNFGLDVSAFYRDIDYETAPQDRLEGGGRLNVTYNASILLAATLYGNYMNVQYKSVSRDDRENEAGIRFLYRINRNISATLDGWRAWRYSTDAVQEYTDNRILLSLLYSSGPQFSATRDRR